ncbi:hypothetical protein F5878DRAFT_499207, partial [Lentinula raphanica]
FTAYKAYRQYRSLHVIGSLYGFSLDTRRLQNVVCSVDGVDICLADVYNFLTVQENTFANKKSRLAQAHFALGRLSHVIANQVANDQLLDLSQTWYPYTLACDKLLESETGQQQPSVHW